MILNGKYLAAACATLAFACVHVYAFGGGADAAAPDGRINVCAFGAVGDGVHDDTAAFQMAFDVVDRFSRTDDRSWGGGVVGGAAPEICLRAGTYRITRPIVAGRSFTLRGEKGAVIDAKGVKGPALYVDRMWRCTIEGMTFRNGESHVAFWTHNDDTASITIKDCRFENAEKEAVWTESWRSEPVKDDAGKVVKRSEYTAPFEVVRDNAGMPVLKPLVWKSRAPNSTRFTMHDCEMIDCGAAYRGATDGQEISRIWFRSSRPQVLPPFWSGCMCQMTDIRILANIPEGFAKGYIDGRGGAYVLTRVVARSRTAFGAPILATDAPPRIHRDGRTHGVANHIYVWNCEADSANSPSGSFIDFRRRAPAILHVRGCAEMKGASVRLVRIGEVPTDLESMRDAGGECEDNVPLEMTHRWLFEDNAKCFDLSTPAIFAPCLEKPLPYAAFAGYPEADAKIDNPRSASNTVFRACDYGIGMDRGKVVDEAGKLERLFAAAAKAENPLVELPGRTIGLSRTITLPRRISIQGVGRAILCGLNPSNDIFRVEAGDAPLAIDFDNMGFVKGRFAFVASGAGRIHFQNGVFAVNRGFAVKEHGGTLDVTVIDSTVYNPQIALVDGATFRMRDSWVEFLAAKPPYTFIDNKRGTVVLERICGVPITAVNPGNIDRPKTLPQGKYMFWIRNEDGVVLSREFRYGGEFGGIAPLDNYGKGRALIETGFTIALNGGTIPCIYRNNSPEGRVTLNHTLLLGIGWDPPHVGHGVRPQEDWRSGLRLRRDKFENQVNGMKAR